MVVSGVFSPQSSQRVFTTSVSVLSVNSAVDFAAYRMTISLLSRQPIILKATKNSEKRSFSQDQQGKLREVFC